MKHKYIKPEIKTELLVKEDVLTSSTTTAPTEPTEPVKAVHENAYQAFKFYDGDFY